ncbi:glycosyltransferase family 1 protein [Luteibacter sp. 9133]|uniref:glycosyltransferase family 4 protein n=1 Tax=Luteibacter sp. 9133 TaxID=1500891 RepID=UPI00068F934E|nr:glycosyltransferase family 1 protein [Luteibacter sp. 9133]
MKVLIDMQGVQTDSRHRGIGRYCLAAARATLEAGWHSHDISLMFNAALDGVDRAVDMLAEAGLQVERRSFGPIRNTSSDNAANDTRRLAAERVYTFALDAQDADVVWLGSVVEGFSSDALVPHAMPKALTVATLYDLIPLHNPAKLGKSRARDWYMRRIATLRQCDVLLAISEWVRSDAIERLGIEPDRIVTIGAGVDQRFIPAATGTSHAEWVAERFGIERPYVMYSGGFDERKNVLALVESYASLPDDLRRRHSLVVVGRIDPPVEARFVAEMSRLRLRPEEVIFTGFVSDEDLVQLYQACAVFVFPSESEGFGLPVLEAMACGAPTLANDACSLPEVVGNSEALFDAANPGSMSARIQAVLTDAELSERLRRSGLERASHFTWSSVAARFLTAIETHVPRKRALHPSGMQASSLPVFHMDQGNVARQLSDLRRRPGTVIWSGPPPEAGPTEASDRYRLGGYAQIGETGDGREWLCLLAEDATGIVLDEGMSADRLAAEVNEVQCRHTLAQQLAVERDIAGTLAHCLSDDDLARVADALARARPAPHARWLIDVTHISVSDVGTGVHRVVRSILREWLREPPKGIRIEPIAYRDGRYHHAHAYACKLIGAVWPSELPEDIVSIFGNETYIALDWTMDSLPSSAALLQTWRRAGVKMHFIVHDLLPLILPDTFHSQTQQSFSNWIRTITGLADSLHCVSRSTATDLQAWLEDHGPLLPPKVTAFGLGADVGPTLVGGSLSPGLEKALASRPSLLMVGTLEPRKGHAQALDALELLWESGLDVTLIIIGQRGWLVNDLIKRLQTHRENGHRLFWLDTAGDETLYAVYERATVLLNASRGEGYGLPLIEAAQRGKPVIARALRVFREVAGDYPSYFDTDTPAGLATHIARWLAERPSPGTHPPWKSWRESANLLARAVSGEQSRSACHVD